MKLEKHNPVVSYVYILVALFILVLGTQNMAFDMMQKLDKKESSETQLQTQREKLDKLNTVKASLKEKQKEIDKYTVDVSENEILTYLHDYANSIPVGKELLIKSVTLSQPIKNALGFQEMRVGLSVRASDEEVLKGLLLFLTKQDSKYNFIMDKFSYPNDGRTDEYSVKIPLKILFR